MLGGLAFGLDARTALTSAIALLIITCPCALGLAVPAVQIVASNRLFRAGVLVKTGDALERLAEADSVLFDKTGTLTVGRPQLANACCLEDGVLERAATLARASKHPLARAIAKAAGPGSVAANVRETAGEGIEGFVDGKRARLGRADWAGAARGGGEASELWFAVEGDEPVRFTLRDALRSDARETIAALQARGLAIELLSGDRAEAVEAAARELGVAAWRAAVDPTRKAARLEELRAAGHRTLMVGDGLNDAAALALAHVSISPGSAVAASEAAADMVLQGDTLAPIVEAIDVARSARLRVFENFAFAAAYNAIAVPLAALGLVTPLIAAVAMSASSLLVMLNAARLMARG
jgi:Cu2+-exporting ATPase